MSLNRFSGLLILLVFALSGCRSLAGEVRGNQYLPPTHSFSYPIAGSMFGESKISDSYDEETGYGYVQVVTDVGLQQFISYDREEPELFRMLSELQDTGRYRDAMRSYFENTFMPRNYPPESGASIEAAPVFVPGDEREMLFAIIRVPEGSMVIPSGSNRRLDGMRGVLIFFKNGYSYQLQDEAVTAFASDPDHAAVKTGTLMLYARITFGPAE